MKILIVGYGWVGKAMHTLFPKAYVHDPSQKLIAPEMKYDVAFVGVPTPVIGEGKLDTSIVESVVEEHDADLFVIRSTVNPGDTDRIIKKTGKRCVMQPEYLGETVNHPMTDQKARPFIIIGGHPMSRRRLIDLYTSVYNANTQIRQVSAYQAEVIKLSENRAISYKVAQAQELYDVCELARNQGYEVDYYETINAVYGDDPRFNLWWTFVFPEERGFNSSKCLYKDVPAWCAWAESLGYEPVVTRSIVKRSDEYAKDTPYER